MRDDSELEVKRFSELAKKSLDSGYFIFTDFLGLPEQASFAKAKRSFGKIKYTEFGGAPGTERVMIRFGDEDELMYSEPFPIKILKISPKSEKYAEELSHRDYLGSILGLGIERSVIGDIAIRGKEAFVFVKDEIAEYIIGSLEKIRRTDVRVLEVSESELPEGELFRTEPLRIQLMGERVDAAIAKVFRLSRDEAERLIASARVYVSGALATQGSMTPKAGDVISVRGHGRFIYLGASGLSKKGKLNVDVLLYV
ncbi:MAG: hypothetical protein IJY18_00550 [Clostridia bacterium]|nr:hypothetical protein [Clostridia bacterium]